MGQEDIYKGFTKAFVEEPVKQEEVTTPVETQVVETPVEVKTEVKTEAPAPAGTTDDFWSSLNSKLKTDFKSDEDLKPVLEKAAKTEQLEAQLKEFETLKADVEFYKTGVNPLDWFANENAFRVQQFMKANPDKDPSLAVKVFNADLDKLSDLDVLAQYEMLNNDVEGGEAGAKELVATQYSLDLETDQKEWSTLARNQVKKAANLVRKEIKELKDSYKLPEKIDVAAKRQAEQEALAKRTEAIQKGWEEVLPKALNEIKEIDINDLDKDGKAVPLMKYVIDEESKKVLGEEAKAILLANNAEINKESGLWVDRYIKDQYVVRNLNNILKAYATTLVAEVDKKKDEETHNPNPLKTETKPVTDDDVRKQKEVEYALGGQSFKYNKTI